MTFLSKIFGRQNSTHNAQISQYPTPISKFLQHRDLLKAENYFQSLTNTQLIEVYQELLASAQAKPCDKANEAKLQLFLVSVKDAIFRRAAKDHNFAQTFTAHGECKQLVKEIRRATGINSFMSLSDNDSKTPSKIKSVLLFSNKPKQAQKKRILHTCLEYNKVGFTGVNAVATALPLQQREAGIDARMVTPFYDIMTKQDASYHSLEFKGFIEHEFEGKMVTSSIYKVWTQKPGKDGVPQYLIKPDPQFANLFSIDDNQNIYTSTINSSEWARILYFSSAVAAMAANYKGNKHQKSFDGVHCHSWTLGMLSWLLRDHNKKREAAGFPPVHSVLHFHSNTFHDHGVVDAEKYRGIGVSLPTDIKSVNTQAISWLNFDGIIHVSKAFANQALDSEDPEVDMADISREKHDQGRLVGVTNGINVEDWSLTNKKNYHSFTVTKKNSPDGKDITDFVAAKEKVKKELFDAGLIADPKKPLFVYVGRLAEEKGTSSLPEMVKAISQQGGQCIVMGKLMGGGSVLPSVKILREYANGPYKDCFRIYDDSKFQDSLHKEVKKGLLIRMACDFSLIPSERESCGLVFPEAISAGCIPITSGVGGLRDFAKPFGEKGSDSKPIGDNSFNCFVYDKSRVANSKASITEAMRFYKEHNTEARNEVIKRLITESKEYDWSYKIKEINAFYNKIFKSPTKHEQEATENLKQRHLYPLKGIGIGNVMKGKIQKAAQKVSWVAARAWKYLGEFMTLFGLKLEKFLADLNEQRGSSR